jgi:HK97 family phage prohead protease
VELRYVDTQAATNVLGDRQVEVVLSTNRLARDGHIFEPRGCQLENYRANPIVLWQHQPEVPVGLCSGVRVANGDSLVGLVTFAPKGVSEKADEICGLVKSGVVSGVSVGMQPIDAEPLDPSMGSRGGMRVTSWELLEISFVALPSDVGAGVSARSSESIRREFEAVRSWAASVAPPILLTPNQQWEAERQRALRARAASQPVDDREQRRRDLAALERAGKELGVDDAMPSRRTRRRKRPYGL